MAASLLRRDVAVVVDMCCALKLWTINHSNQWILVFIRFLGRYNSSEPRYLGRPFMVDGRPARRYYSGGSGIVFSRETLRLVGNAASYDRESFWGQPDKGPEDLLTSDALKKLRIFPETTLDTHGRQFFLPLGPHAEWNRKRRDINFWFYRW